MKRAIIVKGQSSSGKSTIIRLVYRWLKLYHKPVVTFFSSTSHNPWSGDIECDMQIGHLHISIKSGGDTEVEVRNYLNRCMSSDCNIFIGACRAKGKTNQAVLSILTPYSSTKTVVTSFVNTYHHSSIKTFNRQCALELKTYLMGIY